MIHYDDYNLQLIERAIRHCYIRENYKQVECLLRVRKEMLNAQAIIPKEMKRFIFPLLAVAILTA